MNDYVPHRLDLVTPKPELILVIDQPGCKFRLDPEFQISLRQMFKPEPAVVIGFHVQMMADIIIVDNHTDIGHRIIRIIYDSAGNDGTFLNGNLIDRCDRIIRDCDVPVVIHIIIRVMVKPYFEISGRKVFKTIAAVIGCYCLPIMFKGIAVHR